jgi:hypothetical protein
MGNVAFADELDEAEDIFATEEEPEDDDDLDDEDDEDEEEGDEENPDIMPSE